MTKADGEDLSPDDAGARRLGRSQALLNVGAAFVASAFAATIFLAFGVLLEGLMDDFSISTTTASTIYFAQWLAFGGTSLALGLLSDRVGAVTSVRLGFVSILLGLALLLVSFNFATFVIGFGLMTGAGLSAAFGPLHNLILSSTDDRWKGVALGVIMAAQGIGPFLLVPLIATLASSSGTRTVIQVLLGGSVFLLFTSLLLKEGPPSAVGPSATASQPEPSVAAGRGVGGLEPPNLRVAIAHLLGCASHTIPLVYVVNYGTETGGFSLVQASAVLGVISLVSVVSRLASPVAGNVYGGVRILRWTLPLQLVGILLFILFQDASIWLYYLAASIFGLGFGSEMVLFSLIARQIFPGKIGTPLGVHLLGSGIGMGGGALMGALLLEAGIGYVGLFWFALALGLLAELATFTFGDRPPGEKDAELVPEGPSRVAR